MSVNLSDIRLRFLLYLQWDMSQYNRKKEVIDMSEIAVNQASNVIDPVAIKYTLISPQQFYERINRDLDEPIGLATIYRLVKEKDFPSVKIGGRFFVIEDKVYAWLQSLTGKRKQ